MCKYNPGDHVRVTNLRHPFYDLVGVVRSVEREMRWWTYQVQFSNTFHAVPEHHLVLAEPEVSLDAPSAANLEMDDLTDPKVLEALPEHIKPVIPQADLFPSLEKLAQLAKEAAAIPTEPDPVNHPQHYTNHPSGVECLTITRHMGFALGSAMKYIWRADLKGNAIQDLEKAIFYIQDEIAKRKAAQ